MATAGLVFAEDYVPSPMVADFYSGPVSPNECHPLLGAVLLRRCAGEVIMRFGRALAGLFDASGIALHNQTSGKAEVCLQGLDSEGVKVAGFDPAVSGVGLFKKGVPWRASSFCAFLNKRSWLALICRR
jgi:hypothetical protein